MLLATKISFVTFFFLYYAHFSNFEEIRKNEENKDIEKYGRRKESEENWEDHSSEENGSGEDEPSAEEIYENWISLVEPFESICACKSGASFSEIRKLWDTLVYPHDNACLQCYIKCIYTSLGFVDVNYNLIKDVYLKKALGVTDELFTRCEEETKDIVDLCKKFYKFDECIAN